MTLVISRLFNYFFLPPGIFVVILVGGIIFYFLKRPRVLILTAITSASMIYLLSTEPVRDLLLLPLENYAEESSVSYYELNFSEFQGERDITGDVNFSDTCCSGYEDPSSTKVADCIVLLGGGIYEKSPDYRGNASPYPDAVKRAVYAYLVYKRTELPVITAGGKRAGLESSTPEGEALKYLLIRLGVPEDKIMSETSSRNTYENIKNVKDLMFANGWKRAYIVTSAYHMKRALWVCKRLGVDAIPISTDFKVERGGYTIESFLPGSLAFIDSKKALHEYLGLFYYRIVY